MLVLRPGIRFIYPTYWIFLPVDTARRHVRRRPGTAADWAVRRARGGPRGRRAGSGGRDAGDGGPALREPVRPILRGIAGDPLGHLVHVVQPESDGGRGQVDVLEQTAAIEAVAGVVNVVDPDDPVGTGGGGMDLASALDPEVVGGLARLGGQDLGRHQHGAAQALAVESQAVAVGVDLRAVVAEPGEGVRRHPRVVGDRLGGLDV